MQSFAKCVALAFALCAALSLSPYAATAKSIRVAGQVVDYRAQPVQGATIILYSEPAQVRSVRRAFVKLAETRSSVDGRFELLAEKDGEWPPGTWWLLAYKKGLAMCWTTQDLGQRPSILRLSRVKPLGGVVVDETDRPVAGAKVQLCVKNELMEFGELPLPGPEDWHTRRTDKDGRFLFDNLPDDTTADFHVEAPGTARIWTFRDFGPKEGEQFPVGRTDIRITLPPEARIEGTVVDEGTGAPVSGVRVLARPRERPGARYYDEPATVDPNGRFFLSGLDAGAYLLDVIAPPDRSQEWFSTSPEVTVQHGQRTREVRLAVNRGATLEVVVREAASEAVVPGMPIHVFCARYACMQRTDTNGLARLHVPPGKCTISGYKEDYGGTADHEVGLEKGRTYREEMRLMAWAVHVSGIVTDQDGHPLPESSIVYWPYGHDFPADANGRFGYTYYTSGPGSRQTLLARHEASGLANIAELTSVSEGRRLNGQIVLKPAYTLAGRVTDPNGTGIPAAYVRVVVNSSSHNPHRLSTLTETITDVDGLYRIPAIPPAASDCYYAVVAHAPGYNEISVDPVSFQGPVGEPIHLRTLVLLPTDQAVAGTVVDANDRPLGGALVESPRLQRSWYREHEDALQPHRVVFTDAQGRFRIDALCKGPVEVTASAATAGHQEGITRTSAGEKNVKVVLGQTLSFARSLTGARLPSLAGFDLREPLPGLEGKAVLLCFLDIQQRPCRHVLSQLAERARELTKSNIALVAVQAAPCEAGEPDKLAGQYGADIRFGKVTDNAEDTQRAWGIQSLPWLVLADRDHIVRAEGFAPAALQQKVDELAGRPVPR
jgi:protocatechuate 3,4-dioxygenase beta subunit